MTPAQIDALGLEAFKRRPLEPAPDKPTHSSAALIGFDCEYLSRPPRTVRARDGLGGFIRADVRANQVLCLTVAHGERSALISRGALGVRPHGVRVSDFVREVRRAVRDELEIHNKHLVLASFFSVAELSILDIYDTRENRFNLIPNGLGAFTLEWADELGTLIILDIAVWFPHQNLAAVAKTFNLEKLAYDTSNVTMASMNDPVFLEYARHDAVLAYEIAARWRALALERLGVDVLSDTTPAQAAVRVFRRDFMTASSGRVPPPVRMAALESYWGGNNSAYYRGHFWDELRCYDAVSMYPSCAVKMRWMPRGSDWYMLVEGEYENISSSIDGVVWCSFEFPAGEMYPCLPVNNGGAMYFPTRGESHCTLSEMRYAQEIGATVTLIQGWGYATGTDDLAHYSAVMLMKKEGAKDAAERALYKLLANSLIGKFAQHIRDYDLSAMRLVAGMNRMRLDEFWRIPESDRAKLADWAGSALESQTMLGGAWCPEWSALVIGRARRIQAEAVRRTGALSGITDSIITAEDLGASFDVQGITYKLEVTAARGTFVRSRLYALHDGHGNIAKAALHGAPRTLEMAKIIAKWQWQSTINVRVNRIARVREGLIRGGGIGMSRVEKLRVNLDWDNKRTNGISVGNGMNLIYGCMTLPLLEVKQ